MSNTYNITCFQYLESEPSDRETEIWKELQVTRVAMSRAEDELRQSRADKDSFLNSLNRIAVSIGTSVFSDFRISIQILAGFLTCMEKV